MRGILKQTIHECQIRTEAGNHGKFLGLIPGKVVILVTIENEPISPHDGYVQIVGTLPPVNQEKSEDLLFLKNGGIPFVEYANLENVPSEEPPSGNEYDLYFNGVLLGMVKLVPK